MGLAAARSEGSRNSEHDDLLAGTESGELHLAPGAVLEEGHIGHLVTNCYRGHRGYVELTSELTRDLSGTEREHLQLWF